MTWLAFLYGGSLLGALGGFVWFRQWYVPPPQYRFPLHFVLVDSGDGRGWEMETRAVLASYELEGEPLYLTRTAEENVKVDDSLLSMSQPFARRDGPRSTQPLFLQGQPYDVSVMLRYADRPDIAATLGPLAFRMEFERNDTAGPVRDCVFTRLRAVPYRDALAKSVSSWLTLPWRLLAGPQPAEWQVLLLQRVVDVSALSGRLAALRLSISASRGPTLPLDSAFLVVTAHFRGLRFLLHYWPVSSGIVICGGAVLLSWLLISVYVLVALRRGNLKPDPDSDSKEKSVSVVESPANDIESVAEEDIELLIVPDPREVATFVGELRRRRPKSDMDSDDSRSMSAAVSREDSTVLERIAEGDNADDFGDQSVPNTD